MTIQDIKIKFAAQQLLTVAIVLLGLVPIQLILKPPMLLLERFFVGGGWVQIFLLTLYALFLSGKMIGVDGISRLRLRYWLFFSIFFFSQLILGVYADGRFLMTGELHLPIPAVILGGPIYRGEGFFMITLFISTIILIGPAWCSHLCYFGAWDNILSKNKRPAKARRKSTLIIRYGILTVFILIVVGMRLAGVSVLIVTWMAIGFGIAGILVMILISRRKSYMVHCTQYCPLGSVAVLFGKLYPIKVKIDQNECTLCGHCIPACRYEALSINDIKSLNAGWNCTLCGDCLENCNDNALYFSFGGKRKNAWKWYIAIVIALHVITLGMARI